MLRRRCLGELSLTDTTRGQEVSGGPMSCAQLCHLRGSGLTPGWGTKTLLARRLEEKREKKKEKINKINK